MVQRTRRVVLALGIFVALVAAFVLLFDWNLLKPYAERKVTEATGREPKVVLERRADGRKNWILKKDDQKEGTPPHIGRLTLERGHLTLDDEAPDTHVALDVATEHGGTASNLPTQFSAEGKIKSLKFAASGRGGDVFSLAENSTPFPIAGEFELGNTRAKVDGTITGIAVLSALDLKLDLRGDDLSLLYPLIGVAFIPSPPYRLEGRLVHSGASWEFQKFAGKVGDSDLEGDLTFETRDPRSKLTANLTSRTLDMRDLQGFIGPRRGAKPEEPPAEKQQKAANIAAQKD